MPTVYTKQWPYVCFGQKIAKICERSHPLCRLFSRAFPNVHDAMLCGRGRKNRDCRQTWRHSRTRSADIVVSS
ncbi:hypothetical protein EMO92_07135 [Bifidobacterium reuteri]|uniref:Uncharacterized protein n=1 Tax=Bifidobacterium reuteri TaxID=983706 RepID=A0A5J5E7F1_9BIFI|nr:hypothetical protein EMO92_07135 [Bifidobacterium reuteri]